MNEDNNQRTNLNTNPGKDDTRWSEGQSSQHSQNRGFQNEDRSMSRNEDSKYNGQSYRADDYNNRGNQQSSYGRNSGYNSQSYSSDRNYNDISDNFSGGYNSQRDLRHQEKESQYQPNSDWNKYGRESGFGQSNQRDQSYGQQYGRSYAGSQNRGENQTYNSHQNDWNQNYNSDSQYGSRYGQGREQNSSRYSNQYHPRGADQGSYGQDTGVNSRFQGSNGYSNFEGWDSQNRNYGGNDSQQSIYGSAGFGSLGTGSGSLESRRSNNNSYSYSSVDSNSGRQTPASYYGKGPKNFKRSDERIREELSEMFTRHHDVDASDIEIEVKEGEVTLSGFVPERRMKYLAEDLAEKSMGVRDVTNNIRVRKEDSPGMSSSSQSSDADKKLKKGSGLNPNH